MQFYTDIGGYTGFHADGGWDAPWLSGVAARHDDPPLDARETVDCARVAAALSVATAVTANRYAMARGGYGLIGNCNDSLATLQRAVRGKVTVFQTHGTGEDQQRLAHVAQALAAQDERRANDYLRCARAVRSIPCDAFVGVGKAFVQPSDVDDAAERILATFGDDIISKMPNLKIACDELRDLLADDALDRSATPRRPSSVQSGVKRMIRRAASVL